MDCVQVVESLSQREKNSILHVLQRDEKLRIGQERKISMLKEEIHIIRLKGILRSGDDQAKMCIRCRCEFGLIFNRGSLCPLCRFKICKLCQEVMFNGSWLCKLCYKQRQLKWLTGEWSSFEENPLRKWASGSDLVKGSFQIFTGASSQDIDIDDVPSQTSNNNHSKQSARTARNGHLGPAESGAVKQRVEYPKDADQNRLSHLFDVLRTNRPDRDSSKELQVKRVSSRRYSESDSDSSSSSDREETSNRGSPLAPSITESEHDDRRGDSPRGIDSPRGPDSPRKLSSVSEERDGNIDLSKVVRPKPAPRSPRPTQKTFADDTEVAPKPKPREKRKHLSSPNDSHESRLKSEHLSQVSASRSVDNILGHTLAPEKDRRNRKALSHTELHSESVGRGLRDRSLESLHATAHKSSEHLGSVHAAEKSNSDDQIRRSADNLNTHSSADQNIHDNYKLLGAKVRQDIAEHRQSEDWSDTKGDKVRRHSSDKKQEKDDDIELQVPRAGSPYSCSMDSLPSSHPSPTPVHSLCDSSLPESSDTDSLSRHSHTDSHTDSYTDSHTEVGELSSTESVQREGSEDDYVVEEISKVRFQRVSKKVAQIAMVGKMNRSPRKHISSDGLEVGQRKAQSREGAQANEEGGVCTGDFQHVDIESSTSQISPDPVVDIVFVPHSSKSLSQGYVEQLSDSESSINQASASNNFPFADTRETLKPSNINLVRLNSNISNRSADELSWYEEYGEICPTNIGDCDIEHIQEYVKQRILSYDKQRNPSEADSMEGMIDNMAQSQLYVEPAIHSTRVSEAESEGGFSTPPLSPEAYQVKAGTYTITYMSDDNLDTYTTDENLDASSDASDQSGSDLDETLLGEPTNNESSSSKINDTAFGTEFENEKAMKRKVKSIDSLDLLVMEQGDLIDVHTGSVELEQEFEAAIGEQSRESNLQTSSASESNQTSDKKLSRANTLDILLDQQSDAVVTISYAYPSEKLHLETGVRKYSEQSKSRNKHLCDKRHVEIEQDVCKTVELEPKCDVFKQLDLLDQEHYLIGQQFEKVGRTAQPKAKLSTMKSLDVLMYQQGDNIDPNMDSVELDAELQTALQESGKVNKAIEEYSFQPNAENLSNKSDTKMAGDSKLCRMNTLDVLLDNQGTLAHHTYNMNPNTETVSGEETEDNRTMNHQIIADNNTTDHLFDRNISMTIESPVCKTVKPERNVNESVDNCFETLKNKVDMTGKYVNKPIEEIYTQQFATKAKLSAMKSLDILVYQQGDIIDPTLDNIELDMELQTALKEQHKLIKAKDDQNIESNSELSTSEGGSSLTRPKLCRMNTLDLLLDKQGHIVGTTYDGKTMKGSDEAGEPVSKTSEERKHSLCPTAGSETSIGDSSKCVDIQTHYQDITDGNIKIDNCSDEVCVAKQKLSAMKSLDLLVYEQGDNIDPNTDRVELDMELRAADKELGNTCSTVEDIVPAVDIGASAELSQVVGYVLQQELDDSDNLSVIDEVEEDSDTTQYISQLESNIELKNIADVSKPTNNVLYSSNETREIRKEPDTTKHEFLHIDSPIKQHEAEKVVDELDDSAIPQQNLSSRVKVMEQKVKHIVSGNDTPSPGHAVYKGYDIQIHSKFKKLQNLWNAVEKHEANILDIDDGDYPNDPKDSSCTTVETPDIASSNKKVTLDPGDSNTPIVDIQWQPLHTNGGIRSKETTCSKDPLIEKEDSEHGKEHISSSTSDSIVEHSNLQKKHSERTSSSHTATHIRTGTYTIQDMSQNPNPKDINLESDITTSHVPNAALDEGLRTCHSISEMNVPATGSMTDGRSLCHSISDRSSIMLDNSDVFDDMQAGMHDPLSLCHSIEVEDTFINRQQSGNQNSDKLEHKVLVRLTPQNQGQLVGNLELNTADFVNQNDERDETDSDMHIPVVNLLTSGQQPLPPLGSSQPECFKAPPVPHLPDRRSSCSSVSSSPELRHEPSFTTLDSPRSEKFSSRSSPQTISEGSTSQDDSGLVSGGSWGPTPEHKRTDSGYSQSSLPSTLSTVTDKSEDEDIDRMFASAPRPRHGNLLSVVSDSRESIASYYSDAGDIAYSKIPVSGEILFGLNYNYKTGMLEVAVKQCRNIAAADSKRNRSDPYVKTYLLPDKTRNGKRKTKVKKHTLSPTFDETLKYVISKSELENRTLWVTVWHNDRFGRNDFLGEVTINFDYYKFDEPFPKWYLLQERLEAQPTSMMTYKGDLSLTILYVPPDKLAGSPTRGKGSKGSTGKGQLHVTVKEARNLTAVRSNGFSDTFCKGYLLPERHRSSKQKTQVIKKDCSPTWDHTFVFEDVTLIELRERCLELTIWDYEKLASNDFLGGTRLNLGTGLSQGRPVDWMDARGEEMSMWQAMLDRPNISIDGALILRPNMEKRKF